MKYIKNTIIIASGIVLIFFIILVHYGLFSQIEFTKTQSGPYTLVYEKYIGDYSKMGKVTDKIYYYMKNETKISPEKGFGIFYDDPQKVAPEKCRSVVGVILENASREDIEKIEKEYKVKTLPQSRSIMTEFPLKGNLSYMLGAIRVYPEMMRYVQNKQIKPSFPMEIYDLKNEKIYYLMMTDLSNSVFMDFLK